MLGRRCSALSIACWRILYRRGCLLRWQLLCRCGHDAVWLSLVSSMVVLPRLLWRQCDLFLQNQLSSGVLGGEVEESWSLVLLLLFLCVMFAASPSSVCGCRSSVLALVFPHFGGSSKVAYL
jgi:hypothetical protein